MSLIAEWYRKFTKSSSSQVPLRGYKVTDVNRTKKIGIACRSLEELKKKSRTKFNISEKLSNITVFLTDGSQIDDEYFLTLDPHTTLIICKPGEDIMTDADILSQMLCKANKSYLQKGEKSAAFLTDKLKSNVALLYKTLNDTNEKTLYSRREDHPEWFEGLDNYSMTKESYLHRRCQDRIRGYLYKTMDQIRVSEIYNENLRARKQLQDVIAFFKLQLRNDHYFGYYFDRSCAVDGDDDESDQSDDETDNVRDCCYEHCPCRMDNATYERYLLGLGEDIVDAKKVYYALSAKRSINGDVRNLIEREKEELHEAEIKCSFKLFIRCNKEMKSLCNKKGVFTCSGIWNLDKCSYKDSHKINPYRSREELVLFSTWNLDHKIERSRTLVPQILEAAEKGEIDREQVIQFYENLFTVKNLRLVHIVCHDKGSHK